MAIIKIDPAYEIRSGKHGGQSIQYSRSGPTIKNNPINRTWRNQRQDFAKRFNLFCVQHWKNLSAAEQTVWDDWAATYPQRTVLNPEKFLSGYELFVKRNYYLWLNDPNINDFMLSPEAGTIPEQSPIVSINNLQNSIDITDRFIYNFGILPNLGDQVLLRLISYGQYNAQFFNLIELPVLVEELTENRLFASISNIDISEKIIYSLFLSRQISKGKIYNKTFFRYMGYFKPPYFNVQRYAIAAVFGAGVWQSFDWGETWQQNTGLPDAQWSGACISADRRIQAVTAVGGYIYISYDYGQNFNPVVSAGQRRWYDIAMSADGKYITTHDNLYYIYRSDDYGQTFNAVTSAGQRRWAGIAISASGMYQMEIVSSGGGIYRSEDFGVTWSLVPNTLGLNWDDCTMDISGRKSGANVLGGYIYLSDDFMISYQQNSAAGYRNWNDISMSDDGQYISAVVYISGYIYRSDDFGQTWQEIKGPGLKDWRGIAVSNDGRHQIACSYSGGIWFSSDYGLNWNLSSGTTGKQWQVIHMGD